MKVKPITNIDTALRIYYQYPEIGNPQIKELFGISYGKTMSAYKEAVKNEQIKREVKTSQMYSVNTRVAYEVWGIDVEDLEQRRDKLKKLGLTG